MSQYFKFLHNDSVWSKIIGYSVVIFLIRLADSLVSFWAPDLIQSSLNNSFYMGLVISFQSVVGLAADLVFPIFLKNGSVKKLTILAITMSGLTISFLYVSTLRPWIVFFLIAMAIWGIYYELAGFSIYQFVDNVSEPKERSRTWAIIGTFTTSAYLLGPIITVFLLTKGNILVVIAGLVLLLIALFLFLRNNRMFDRPLSATFDGIKPLEELTYWSTLLRNIWPVVLISLLINIIDSTFWTTGVIWTIKLTTLNPLGSLLIPFYQGTTVLVGLWVARWEIYHGKKKMALRFLVLCGLSLIALMFSDSILWVLLVVLISSGFLSVTIPLVEGIYSDFIARLGGERKHMVGLNGAVANIGYIIWPPVAGFLSSKLGEKMTFVWVGILIAIFSVVLYSIIPKKIKLPQEEISDWKD